MKVSKSELEFPLTSKRPWPICTAVKNPTILSPSVSVSDCINLRQFHFPSSAPLVVTQWLVHARSSNWRKSCSKKQQQVMAQVGCLWFHCKVEQTVWGFKYVWVSILGRVAHIHSEGLWGTLRREAGTGSWTVWERMQGSRGSDRGRRLAAPALEGRRRRRSSKKRGADAPDWLEFSSPQLMRSSSVMPTFAKKRRNLIGPFWLWQKHL